MDGAKGKNKQLNRSVRLMQGTEKQSEYQKKVEEPKKYWLKKQSR